MSCPVCGVEECHYWQMRQAEAWHPAPARYEGRDPDHLPPIYRLMPNHGSGIFVMGLDPREACYVFGRGYATLDGVRYKPSFEGWGGTTDGDGRVSVRFQREMTA